MTNREIKKKRIKFGDKEIIEKIKQEKQRGCPICGWSNKDCICL